MVLLHMGPLHPYEQALTLLLAFGPFLLLGLVIAVRRRRDARDSGQRDERDEGPVRDGLDREDTPAR